MIQYLILLLLAIASFSCSDKDKPSVEIAPEKDEFLRAVDLSFLPQIEEKGIIFTDENQNLNALQIFQNNGANAIRLRLWHTPKSKHSSFDEVKTFAKQIKSAGLRVWLTVHYSDTWADPGNQSLPQVWENLDLETLKDSVYLYTAKIISEIEPNYIQIGNEINLGFLHPSGDRYNNKTQFTTLLAKAIQAVRDNNPDTQIILHYAGISEASSFFSDVNSLDYDIIGLSYYPIWHGKDLNELQKTLISLQSQFDKEVLIAETAYPFTLGWNDWTNNIIGSNEQLIPQYPATPEGQKDFLLDVRDICQKSKTMGFCYWGAEWVAFDGAESKKGSSWENQTLFNFNNETLPAMKAFHE